MLQKIQESETEYFQAITILPEYYDNQELGDPLLILCGIQSNSKDTNFTIHSISASLFQDLERTYLLQNFSKLNAASVGPLEEYTLGYSVRIDPNIEVESSYLLATVKYSVQDHELQQIVFDSGITLSPGSSVMGLINLVALMVVFIACFFLSFLIYRRIGKPKLRSRSNSNNDVTEWIQGLQQRSGKRK